MFSNLLIWLPASRSRVFPNAQNLFYAQNKHHARLVKQLIYYDSSCVNQLGQAFERKTGNVKNESAFIHR
jgi:hypothetical protein